jgi:pyruvate dehydrogenase E2 component (dihydrolipoamide acetyltransferase)
MDLKLPALGEGADSGTVVNVFVKEGDQITKDQPLIELENEKAVATIPSTGAGTVTKLFVKTGDKISVGQRIVSLGEVGGVEPGQSPKPDAARKSKPKAAATPAGESASDPDTDTKEEPDAPRATPGVGPAAAPSLRKLARDLGIDLTRVRGSQAGGRIVLEDVRAYIQRLQNRAYGTKAGPDSAPTPVPTAAEPIDFSKWGAISQKPLSPLRQVIARRMSESWTAVPRVTQFDEADITDLMSLRKKYAATYEQHGTRLTLTGFALKAIVDTLKMHPLLNSSLDERAQAIVLKEYYHLGVAVDTEAGLIVPVIRDVDKKSLLDLSKELEDLAKRARDRKISADELKGGTFTISNQGGIGGGHFTPIVNKPEVAILGLGRGAMKPAVRANGIEARLLLPIALSYDHRVIDGGEAARFIVDLVTSFENFKVEDASLELASSSSSFSSSSSSSKSK